MGMEATGDLYDHFTSLMTDKRRGREFRAFLNSHVGRAYFDNNKEDEGNTVQELSKLIERCFLVII